MKEISPTSLTALFNAEVQSALAEFGMERNMCALSVSTAKETLALMQTAPNDDIAVALKEIFLLNKGLLKQDAATAGVTSEQRTPYGLVRNISLRDATGDPLEIEETFYHELGHILTKNGMGNSMHAEENAAETYAHLRLLQRHGKFERDESALCEEYLSALLNEDEKIATGYFNLPVFQVLTRLRAENKIPAGMSPHETVAYADRIVETYSLNEETLHQLWTDMQGARDIYKAPVSSTADIVDAFTDLLSGTTNPLTAAVALGVLDCFDLGMSAESGDAAAMKALDVIDDARRRGVDPDISRVIDHGGLRKKLAPPRKQPRA